MITFEVTWSKVENPIGCTIREAYSGARCPGSGTVELDVVARFDDERGRQHYRTFELCPVDAVFFAAGFANGGVAVEMTNR